jgi:hypothetical protein
MSIKTEIKAGWKRWQLLMPRARRADRRRLCKPHAFAAW